MTNKEQYTDLVDESKLGNFISKKSYCIYSNVNQRDNNEDSFLMFNLLPNIEEPAITVLAIADGMGGHEHGEHVSKEGLRRFSQALFEALVIKKSLNIASDCVNILSEEIVEALNTSLEQTNGYIHRMVQANNWQRAGSTIVVAIVYKDTVVVANLGDSPLYHFQAQTQKVIEVTENHSIAGILLRTEQISAEMAKVHSGRHQLEYFLGAPRLPNKTPIKIIKLASNDILLLCSDGVSDKLEIEQIANILKNTDTLADKAGLLVKTALEAKETDNQTLILWRYQDNLNQENGEKKNPIRKIGSKKNSENKR